MFIISWIIVCLFTLAGGLIQIGSANVKVEISKFSSTPAGIPLLLQAISVSSTSNTLVQSKGLLLDCNWILGLNNTKIKFVKKFVNLKKYINLGLKKFSSQVRSRKYPSKEHSY